MSIAFARMWLAAAGIAVGAAAVPRSAAADPPPSCSGLEPGPTHTVARVIDGETLALDDGREVRLIGMLAPRAFDVGAVPGTWPPEMAATAELAALLVGRTVELAFDREREDRYGRLQAHVFLAQSGERRWVQGHLLAQGLARAYADVGGRRCVLAALEAEEPARVARRGLWGQAAYAVRPASRPELLGRHRVTYQVAEGRLASVAETRGTIYLNFRRTWAGRAASRGFSASLRRSDRALLGAHAHHPSLLTGRRLRVRGWIERRRGPAVDLSLAGLVEVLDEAPGMPSAVSPPESRDAAPQTKSPGLVETGR